MKTSVNRISECRTHIRDAAASDSDAIARLSTELGYPVSAAEIAARMSAIQKTDGRYVAVACVSQSRVLGWVAAEHRLLLESGERVEIVGLVVDSSARRTGIGRALVSAVESWTVTRGLSKVFVRSNVARTGAHQFYRGLGYERSKTQHAYAKTV